MDLLYGGKWGLLYRSSGFCMLRRLVVRPASAAPQRLANLSIGIGFGNPMHLGVKGKHTATFTAVITAPVILLIVQPHFSSAVAANRAVYIGAVAAWPPNLQTEQIGDIFDVKREVVVITCHKHTPFPMGEQEAV